MDVVVVDVVVTVVDGALAAGVAMAALRARLLMTSDGEWHRATTEVEQTDEHSLVGYWVAMGAGRGLDTARGHKADRPTRGFPARRAKLAEWATWTHDRASDGDMVTTLFVAVAAAGIMVLAAVAMMHRRASLRVHRGHGIAAVLVMGSDKAPTEKDIQHPQDPDPDQVFAQESSKASGEEPQQRHWMRASPWTPSADRAAAWAWSHSHDGAVGAVETVTRGCRKVFGCWTAVLVLAAIVRVAVAVAGVGAVAVAGYLSLVSVAAVSRPLRRRCSSVI